MENDKRGISRKESFPEVAIHNYQLSIYHYVMTPFHRIVLRFILCLVAGANLFFAYLFLFEPALVSNLYQGLALDNLHLFLMAGLGNTLIVIAIGALLCALRPIKYSSIVLVLILFHFGIFVTDLIIVARNQMDLMTLLPEMIYAMLVAIALIRFFPVKSKKKADPVIEAPAELEPETVEPLPEQD